MQFKNLIIIGCILPILIMYFFINKNNFEFQINKQRYIIEHPEKLPQAEYAKYMFPGFSNVTANIYWLQAIQYIGRNAISSEYRKYLYEMMHLITELNPYFEAPYIIGQLLIPSGNDSMQENFSEEEKLEHTQKGILLGLKGIEKFCDKEKVQKIFEEDNISAITQDKKYKNPCRSYHIPYYLAYTYFYYKNDHAQAAQYYKVVSAQEDAPKGAKSLAAIMAGRSGQREKSLFMFLSLAQTVQQENEACIMLAQSIESGYISIQNNNMTPTGNFIQATEILRNKILPEFTKENESILLSHTECSNFIIKAIRELSLLYLEIADTQYVRDFPDKVSAMTPEKLFELGYIDFIPTDYQQYGNYGIVYRYNKESGRFDYEMGNH